MSLLKDVTLKSLTSSIKNGASDLLSNSDFISRTIGMTNSYEDIMFIVQSLGREPISLLGKDYAFIYDHVRRNYLQGTYIENKDYSGCYKFTFYKDPPTVKFADPYNDTMNLLDRWTPNMNFETTSISSNGGRTSIHYSESNDGYTNNKYIGFSGDIDNGNPGTATNSIVSYGPEISGCDLVNKTNQNFNHGKYETLIARFHTNAETSKDTSNPTQTAISKTFGMSHGRNLLKLNETEHNGYDNPYCRVWTYHHQYNQLARAIRPFEDALTQENLEEEERVANYETVGFRTSKSENYGFDGGSKRLDDYGVLNYRNGMVNIAPTAKIRDYFDGKDNDYDKQIISTKKCMFSIENLAWRDSKSRRDEFDAYGLSPEQKGPLGGRIMWFPPYDIKFSEDVSVHWNNNKFIGRGEDVYTYTNTERRGSLSFTMIIDHPSVLDYWTGHERNGMKNQGTTLAEGNSGGVDNKQNQENTLLRFFAGCEILSAKPQEYWTHDVKPEKTPEPDEPAAPNPTEPEVVEETVKKQICAILYFPNNYSGKDDRNGKVNPIYYLMNGVGTQKYVNTDTYYAEDIPTRIDVSPSGALNSGGYEVKQGIMGGISQALQELDADYSVISGTYADTQSKERKAQYLTSNSGVRQTAMYGSGENYLLAKIVGDKAMSMSAAKIQSNLTGATHQWYRKRYYYRVDKAYENQDFSRPMSYIDSNSFGLNGNGFEIVRQHSNVIKNFGLKDDSDEYTLVSFTDLFVAMEGDSNNVVSPHSNGNVKRIREIFKDKDKYSNIKINFKGHASFQGYGTSNNDLARNRGITLKNWLKSFNDLNGVEMGDIEIINQPRETKTNTGEVGDELVKIWRSASITIEYEEKKTVDASVAETPKVKEGETQPSVDRVEVKNKETSDRMTMKAVDVSKGLPITNTFDAEAAMNAPIGMRPVSTKGVAPDSSSISPFTMEELMSAQPQVREVPKDETTEKQGIVKRYDNEGEFFEVLDREAPFLHHLITDKIKYFDPAFHAISPEGFNARLTFLHQCTRQGSTVDDSMGQGTAYNLAFGRPPVCVLRLGDFYYTKIIITGLNIQYETPQWDLNPEGIGVMPMFANISIQFTFLGGSDLAGPIARLQNAVSFNYYANTSVYDNRAEKVEYDPDGSGREIKFKGYTYPNRMSNGKINLNRIGEHNNEGNMYGEDF